MPTESTEITELLDAWSAGETGALEQLLPLVYDDLRRMARRYFKDESSSHTLQPTAVVHEAYLKFKNQRKVQWQSRAEFFGVAAKQMYRILVDHARQRHAEKRGGKALIIPLEETMVLPESKELDLIALDDALQDLAKLDERQSRIVVMRIFGGLTLPEVAAVEGIGRATVHRAWNAALLWLRRELSRSGATPP